MRRITGWQWILAAASCAAPLACATLVERDDAWLHGLRQREAALPAPSTIGSAADAFIAEVPAHLTGAIESGEEAVYLGLSIGSDSPIECALYYDEVEAASTLQLLARQVFASLASDGAEVERSVEAIDAGAIDTSPFLAVDWRYRQRKGESEVVGELKQRIASREGRSVYCVHHENGYGASFDEVFRALVGSLRFSAYDELRPYFTQIYEISAAGESLGYSVLSLTVEEDGDPRVIRYTATAAPTADGGLSARDLTEVQHTTLEGRLLGALFTDFRDGEVDSSLLLENMDDVAWQVSGERAGKNVRAIFEARGLSSWLAEPERLGEMLTATGGESVRRLETWAPQVSLESPTARELRLLDVLSEGRHAAAVRVAGRDELMTVDADGMIDSLTLSSDGGDHVYRRIAVQGALR